MKPSLNIFELVSRIFGTISPLTRDFIDIGRVSYSGDRQFGYTLCNNKKTEVSGMNPAPIKDLISFEDFEKLDIRVGTIIPVSEVEKSNKLMKLTF